MKHLLSYNYKTSFARKLFLPGLLVIFILAITGNQACKKDNNESPYGDPDPPDTTIQTIDSTFIFGKANDLINITTFSTAITIIAPWHSGEIYTFDVDEDGNDDFRFDCVWNISPGGIDERSANIRILNPSFQVAGIVFLDSIFMCDTNFSGMVFTNYYNTFTYNGCGGGAASSLQSTEEEYYPVIFSQGDTLEETAYWQSENLCLALCSNTSYNYTYYDIIRPFWNNMGKKYILIRKINDEHVRYGWLAISVSDFREIYFFEYALQ